MFLLYLFFRGIDLNFVVEQKNNVKVGDYCQILVFLGYLGIISFFKKQRGQCFMLGVDFLEVRSFILTVRERGFRMQF